MMINLLSNSAVREGGRTKSILMSMPPEVMWEYGYQRQESSPLAAWHRNFLLLISVGLAQADHFGVARHAQFHSGEA